MAFFYFLYILLSYIYISVKKLILCALSLTFQGLQQKQDVESAGLCPQRAAQICRTLHQQQKGQPDCWVGKPQQAGMWPQLRSLGYLLGAVHCYLRVPKTTAAELDSTWKLGTRGRGCPGR